LKNIITALNSTITALGIVDGATGDAFGQAQRDIRLATLTVNNYEQELKQSSAAAEKAAESTDKLEQELKQSSTAADKTTRSLDSMRSPLLNISAGIYAIKNLVSGLSNITGISDEFVLTSARLDLMNDGMQTTQELQDKIFESAKRSRAAYADTAASVAKLGITAGDNFKNTEEIVAFSELMNKSFKVGGAGQQEQAAGMYQLTQAMAAGKLQGDEFRSITENAPLLAKAIKDYTGNDNLKEMAAEGKITSDIIKGAIFSAADNINTKFETLPVTFGDVVTDIQNKSIRIFQPVINGLSQIINNDEFNIFVEQAIIPGIQMIADAAAFILGIIVGIGNWFVTNWGVIQPILGGAAVLIGGIVIGITAYNAVVGISKILTLAAATVTAVKTGATIAETSATAAQTAVQWGLNASMLACPITWIILGIIAIIAIIAVVVIAVMNLWNTNIDFRIGVIRIWNSILGFFDQIPLFFMGIGNAISDAFGWAKVTTLQIMEGMANGVIDIINNVIAAINTIPGVAIDPLNRLSFAADAALEEEARKKQRDFNYAMEKDNIAAKAAQRETDLLKDEASAKAAATAKQSEINNPQDQSGYWDQFKPDGGKLDSIGKIDDEVSITEEDIKLLKDVAATEFVNRYTTLRPEMHVTFGDVRETADVEEILYTIETMVDEALASSPVGGN
jgi:tape measure domain-containing protein